MTKSVHSKLKKQISKDGFFDLTGAGLDDISETVEKEALRRKGKNKKSSKRNKKSCGCDA
jgi:hypothetical protein